MRAFANSTHTTTQGSVAQRQAGANVSNQDTIDAMDAEGPFTAEVNGLLAACFGDDLASLDASWSDDVDEVGANATTEGRKMRFGSDIREDANDPFSMEVIAHEVAHALAGGGSGQTEIDEAGDPGETSAYATGRAFADFTRGATVSAPSLAPARGGRARVHRHNSLEHKDAVDGAVDRGRELDGFDTAEPLLKQPVTLKNGVDLSAGQVSMLMGDYFGVMRPKVDGEGNELDPMASWEQLDRSDPDKLRKLLAEIAKEGTTGADPATLNELTDGRYLDLALVNDCHFSDPSNLGTDNNIGTYENFHALAMEAKAAGDLNRALGLEASAMHFLTDRHAPGHLMDKDHVIDAAPRYASLPGELGENGHVKHVHDHVNANGLEVEAPNGDAWKAYGDGMWFNPLNGQGRDQVAKSVITSYAELAAVEEGGSSLAQSVDGMDATRTLPMFDPSHEDHAEERAGDLERRESGLEMIEYLVR